MTVFVKNKLAHNGKTIGYTVCADGIESKYSVHDAVKLVYTATHSNAIIVRNKDVRLKMNDNHIKARLRNSHLRAKSGQMPIIVVDDNIMLQTLNWSTIS